MDRKCFQRNLYSDGMLLDASDFENQQEYQNEKRQLINRTLLGFGVAWGFDVTYAEEGLHISAGFALDTYGQELYLPFDQTVAFAGLLPVSGSGEGVWYLCASLDDFPAGEACVLPEAGGDRVARPNRMEERCRFRLVQEPDRELRIARLRLAGEAGALRVESVESPVDKFTPALQKQAHDAGATGRLTLHAGARVGETVYSRELPHGLGTGDVLVTLAVEEGDGIVSGSPDLFGVPVRTAVRVFPERGSFVAAVKTLRPLGALHLRWYARHAGSERRESRAAPKNRTLHGLDPPFVVVRPTEKQRFTPVFSDGSRDVHACRFSLNVPDGGRIESDGTYTAPDWEGMFQIAARDASNPSETVTALVVVRR